MVYWRSLFLRAEKTVAWIERLGCKSSASPNWLSWIIDQKTSHSFLNSLQPYTNCVSVMFFHVLCPMFCFHLPKMSGTRGYCHSAYDFSFAECPSYSFCLFNKSSLLLNLPRATVHLLPPLGQYPAHSGWVIAVYKWLSAWVNDKNGDWNMSVFYFREKSRASIFIAYWNFCSLHIS